MNKNFKRKRRVVFKFCLFIYKHIMSKEIRQMINKVKNFKEFLNESLEPIKTWGGDNLGDVVVVIDGNTSELPETQNENIPDGEYVLSIIPINKTTLYIKGLLTRDAFKKDDYDGWQTDNLNYIKKSFDSSDRTPIIVLENKDGNYFVIDGHHRLTIANEIGRETILAYVKKYGIENDKHIFF